MRFRMLTAMFALGFAFQAGAGFTTVEFLVNGDSRVGIAPTPLVGNPTAFSSQTATDVRSVNGAVGPVPGPVVTDTFDTSVQDGVLWFDKKNASTQGRASGIPDAGETLSLLPTAGASNVNRDQRNSQFKSTAISTVTFMGDIFANLSSPGVAISYSADYSMTAFAGNNAPPVSPNNNSAYTSVSAVLTLENLTKGTVVGQNTFINDTISQTYCGPRGSCFPNNSLNNLAMGTVFLPLSGQSNGDLVRMTIEVKASTDAYAKGFFDSSGGPQPASGTSTAWFDQMDVTLLLIPEPASLALLLVGAAFVPAARRLRRRLLGTPTA